MMDAKRIWGKEAAVQVAVIDDGVNLQVYSAIGNLEFDLTVNGRGHVVRRKPLFSREESHGTTCAAILKKYAPDARIGSIQVLSPEDGRGEPKRLLSALKWCGEHQIPILHLSLGTRLLRDFPDLYRQCQSLTEAGCTIVAALSNSMKASAPACFPNVIGVRASEILEGDQYLVDCKASLLEAPFVASGKHTLTRWDGTGYMTPLCNSFAAPLITAQVHQLLKQKSGLSCREVCELLGLRQRGTRISHFWRPQDIPVIGILNDRGKILSQLNGLFFRSGYDCLPLSREDLSAHTSIVEAIGYYERMLEPDVVLTAWDSPEPWMDYRIHVDAESHPTRYCGEDVFLSSQASSGSLRYLLRYLERMK